MFASVGYKVSFLLQWEAWKALVDSPKRWYDLPSLRDPTEGIRTILIFPRNVLQIKSHQVKHSPSTYLLLSFFAKTISLRITDKEVGALQSRGQFFAKCIPKLVVTDVKLA